MAGEFSEKYLQKVLGPIFRNIALGEDNKISLFSENALQAGLAGALTAGMMNSVGISSSVNRERTIETLMRSAGFSYDDASFMLDTQAALEAGFKVAEADLKRFAELGSRFTPRMQQSVKAAIEPKQTAKASPLSEEQTAGMKQIAAQPSLLPRSSVSAQAPSPLPSIPKAQGERTARQTVGSPASPVNARAPQEGKANHCRDNTHGTDA